MENATVEVKGLSIINPKCSNCLSYDKKLFACGKCLCAKYCSKQCQKNHWKLHKMICNEIPYDSPETKIEKYQLKSINYDAEGNYRKAGEYLTYIYNYYIQVLGENDDKTCKALLDLAGNYHKQKKYSDADVLLRSVFTPIEKKLGKNMLQPNFTAELMNVYASNLIALEEYDEAVKIFNLLLNILPEGDADDNRRISCTSNLAIAMLNSNRLDEADAILTSLLKKTRAIHGPQGICTLNVMNSIGTLNMKFKRYKEAEAILTECFELQKKSIGINHPFSLSTLNNICHIYINQSKFDEAFEACKLCLEKRKLVLGDENRDTLFSMHNYGVVCIAQRNYVDAEKVLNECLKKMKAILGDNDVNTINCLAALIRVYERTGRNNEALKFKKTIQSL